MKSFKKTIGLVANIIIWLFVVFAVVVTVVVISAQSNPEDGIPTIGGKAIINIVSDSMAPTIKKGDMIFGKRLSSEDKNDLQVGDVITYFADIDGDGRKNEINTHTIVEIIHESEFVTKYRTKGDNPDTNPVADEALVDRPDVIAKWTGDRVAVLGSVINFLNTSTGFLVVIVLPLFAIFIFALYRFIKAIIGTKDKDKRKISAEEEELIRQEAIAQYLKSQGEAEKSQPPQQPTKEIETVKPESTETIPEETAQEDSTEVSTDE